MRDFGQVDVFAISTSGGIDSWHCTALIPDLRARYPLARFVAIHADMGELEHADSREMVEGQAAYFGAELFITHRNSATLPDWSLLAQCLEKGTWSLVKGSINRCQATSDHKRGPIWRVYTQLAKDWHASNNLARPCRIIEVVGLTSHEGKPRRRRIEAEHERCPDGIDGRWRLHKDCSNGQREVTTWLPLADRSKRDLWDSHAAAVLRGAPPVSDIYRRLPRYSCSFCVFASRDAINVAAQLYPDLFAKYVAAELVIGPWSSKFTLADVAADIAAGRLVESATTWGDQY